MSFVPDLRIRVANDAHFLAEGDYVLYWMTAFRRTEWNFSLQRAIEWSRDLKKPLLVFEALRCGYAWASDRIHSSSVNAELGRERVTALFFVSVD